MDRFSDAVARAGALRGLLSSLGSPTHTRPGAGALLRGLALLLCAALLLVGGACTKESAIASIGAPGTRLSAEVADVTVRYEYLDAFVAAGGFRYRLFFPNSETCASVLAEPEGVQFVWLGVAGRLIHGEARCDAIGVLSLREWRDRGPRRSREPLPRGQANFREVWRDDEMVILRGRFPLAAMVGWAGGHDTMAIIPDSDLCTGFLERGVASIEFRARGENPLVLIDRSNRCPITGFAQPLSQTR